MRRLRERLEGLGRWLLPPDRPADAIYGTVLTAAVMAAYSDPPVHLGEVAVGVVTTVLVYWLAHVYAEELARGPGQEAGQEAAVFARRRMLSTLRVRWVLVRACVAPLLVLLMAVLFGAGASLALSIAVWFTVLLLVAWGVVTARRDGLTGGSLLLAGALAGVLGLAIVALKAGVD